MQCEELRNLVPLSLVDLLDEKESESVRRHLDAGCPSCASELAAAKQTLDLLPLALAPEAPSPAVKSRLMTTVRREETGKNPAATPAAAPAAPARQAGAPWPWIAAAALGGLIVGGAVVAAVMGSRSAAASAAIQEELNRANGEMGRQAEELGAAKIRAEQAESSVRLLSSPGVKVFDLAPQSAGMKGAGRIFWDKTGGTWEVFCSEMPPIAPGRVYQLWFITPTAKISAGLLRPSADGTAHLSVKVPSDQGLIVAATITEEPEAGSAQPTGAIRLLGQV